jgi:DNA-directed RNA polymerase specialized sigma subunit
MTHIPEYTRNHELFTHFYGLQGSFAGHLAARPDLLRAWLDSLPPREPESAESARTIRFWRTARLSSARRRELSELVARVQSDEAEAAALAAWLLVSVPVCTFFEMAAARVCAAPALGAEAGDCHRQLLELRETLFLANYGLAKAAAKRRRPQDYADMLGAASDGLLDAIDRYVPDGRAARFAYFAGYWIRYHMARQFQKSGSVVSFPVNQHRIGRRIHRYLASREPEEAPPSPEEVCQELRLGRAAYFWQQQRPQVVSLHGSGTAGPEAPAMELRLCDPAPEPADRLEQAEIADRLRLLLRAQAGPAARLMLAYVHGVGPLADAAEDYLASLQDLARTRLAGGNPDGVNAGSSDGGNAFSGEGCWEHGGAQNYPGKEYQASATTG